MIEEFQTALGSGSFSLLIVVDGGQEIQAQGSNKSPAGYERFLPWLEALFQPFISNDEGVGFIE